MESRINKYSSDDVSSRTVRNARLYKEIYGKYDADDNLPLEDNTDEIDMNRLQEILHNNKDKEERRTFEKQYNVIEQRKRNVDEQRLYDINKILEKAKYENNKLKENTESFRADTSILSKLESRDVGIEDIKDKMDKPVSDDEMSMTRELKFKGLSDKVDNDNPLLKNVMPDNDISFDLFKELKPTDNTITTKPIREVIKEDLDNKDVQVEDKELDMHSGNTSDIDIIKIKESADGDKTSDTFFTNSYEFSVSDFLDDSSKKGNVLKIILLFLAIVVFAGVIAYFVVNYGFGV